LHIHDAISYDAPGNVFLRLRMLLANAMIRRRIGNMSLGSRDLKPSGDSPLDKRAALTSPGMAD
jgi:hypothetical protein